jgi:hypothetical protein
METKFVKDQSTTEKKLTGFDKKFTLEEYLQELQDYENIPKPSKTNGEDPLYQRKYAMSMPPLSCYRYLPPK